MLSSGLLYITALAHPKMPTEHTQSLVQAPSTATNTQTHPQLKLAVSLWLRYPPAHTHTLTQPSAHPKPCAQTLSQQKLYFSPTCLIRH